MDVETRRLKRERIKAGKRGEAVLDDVDIDALAPGPDKEKRHRAPV